MNLIQNFLDYKKDFNSLKKETLDFYYNDINDFKNFFKKDILDIDKDDILHYIEFLKKSYHINSVIRKISTIKIFYKYLLKKKVLDISPADGIKIEKAPEKEKEKLEEWEIENILLSCETTAKGSRDRVVIKLLVETNLTINDILALKISDLDNAEYNYVFDSDGIDIIPISSELSEELKEYVDIKRTELCENGSNLVFYGFSRQSFRARFIGLGKKAGIKREITPNLLRNTIKLQKKSDEDISSEEFFNRLRQRYFEIAIGDD